MKANIDPVLDAALGDIFDGLDTDATDPLEKLFADAAFAGHFPRNGFALAEGLRESLADVERTFAKRFQKDTAPARKENADALTDEPLEKRIATDPNARRVCNLREWIKKCVTDGETVQSLIDYAEGNGFHAQAAAIREAAQGL